MRTELSRRRFWVVTILGGSLVGAILATVTFFLPNSTYVWFGWLPIIVTLGLVWGAIFSTTALVVRQLAKAAKSSDLVQVLSTFLGAFGGSAAFCAAVFNFTSSTFGGILLLSVVPGVILAVTLFLWTRNHRSQSR